MFVHGGNPIDSLTAEYSGCTRAVGRADDERRLDPRSHAHRLRQVGRTHQYEQRDEGRLAFFEHDGPSPDDRERRIACGGLERASCSSGKTHANTPPAARCSAAVRV
jgi:hypothetical protein